MSCSALHTYLTDLWTLRHSWFAGKEEKFKKSKALQLLDLELCGRKNILREANTVHFLILLIHQIFFKLCTMLDAGDTLINEQDGSLPQGTCSLVGQRGR